MRSLLRTLFFATAAIGAAVVLYIGLTLPPAAVTLVSRPSALEVTGAYHVHSNRSDGTGTADEIAAAAARAGVAFVILTDHGDGTRVPDAPAYRSGVLVIDAVELNTASGHVVALGFSGATPYPLAGSAADVIADIHRLGGYAVLAHPDSPRDSLRWRGVGNPAGVAFDGIEWLNADSEWRDERSSHLIGTAVRALFRAPESIAALFGASDRTFNRWDQASRARGTVVFGLAALDAHANIPWRESDEPRRQTAFARPSYQTMFRTLAQTVHLDAPLSGDAARDARRVIDAIVHGRSFSIVRALAAPASLHFVADVSGRTLTAGDSVPDVGVPVVFRASVPEAPGVRVSLLRNGRVIGSGAGNAEFADTAANGVYRAQAFWPGSVVPWLVSNQIVIGSPPSAPVASAPLVPATTSVDLRSGDHPWAIQSSTETGSSGALAIDGTDMRFTYRLGPGAPNGQFAALVGAVGGNEGIDRVTFTARADRPTRVSLQIKLPRGGDGRRWRRSVYLDSTARTATVALSEFDPADMTTTRRPIVTPLDSVLFVVDTLNSATGSAGTIWISDVTLGGRQP